MKSQTNRATQISIDLGDERVMPERVECVESLGTPFVISLDVLAPLEVDFQPHLGKPARIKLLDGKTVLRHFHGFITASDYLRESRGGHHYRLTLHPWTYFLSQNREYAIYQDKTATDIIKLVCDEAGISQIDFSKLSKSCDERVYTVQYGESDFAFISRLMEEEGIYYYFEHSPERHEMILCDAPGGHVSANPSKLTYKPSSATIISVEASNLDGSGPAHLQKWTERVSTTAESKVTMRDWDFEKPARPVQGEFDAGTKHQRDTQEVYTFPGKFLENAQGNDASEVAMLAMRAMRRVMSGESQATGLAVGKKVTIVDHPLARMNGEYLIVATRHRSIAESYETNAGNEPAELDEVHFDAIPAETHFHPLETTPKPVVQGLESAIITGPENETIYVDKYGRVKVRFHWDRHGRPGEKTTCWIRVSQTGGLGNQILPRVGHEVLVDFLGGDPDRPVVVGRVFNAEPSNMPIYELPANKTRALWRTLTYGDPVEFSDAKAINTKRNHTNEIMFEDKAGAELIWVHAEKDMKEQVHVDHFQEIGRDRKFYVGRDEERKVDNDQKLFVTKAQTRDIGTTRKTKIGDSDTIDITTSQTLKAGTTIDYKANQSITISVGESSIVLDQSGITIKGMMISINGTIATEMKGLTTKVSGGTLLEMKGLLTTIN